MSVEQLETQFTELLESHRAERRQVMNELDNVRDQIIEFERKEGTHVKNDDLLAKLIAHENKFLKMVEVHEEVECVMWRKLDAAREVQRMMRLANKEKELELKRNEMLGIVFAE